MLKYTKSGKELPVIDDEFKRCQQFSTLEEYKQT